MIPEALVRELADLLGPAAVLTDPAERLTYECDAFTLIRHTPGLVVLPETAEQAAAVVTRLARSGTPFVPRGAGTGLAGGIITPDDCVLISLNRLKRVRRVDLRERLAVVEAGVVNARLSREIADSGYYFAPDPSSQSACTIGGNAATNAGGPHTLKYGVTVNHVLGVELVLPDGRLLHCGAGFGPGGGAERPGLDLTGAIVGSEGTFGLITAAAVRLTRLPGAVRTLLAIFETIDDATHTVSQIVARGITPAAMEIMDDRVLIAVEAAFRVGFPADAGAALIVELDGVAAGLERAVGAAVGVCRENRARSIRVAADDAERALLWKSRKRAAGALGRLTTSYCTQDGVVPRSELPAMLREISEIGGRHAVQIANLIHAGDGNIHPILMYDERDQDQIRRVLAASREIMAACVRRGGTITGEHGIGVEKIEFLELLFTPIELEVMRKLRRAFDPRELCNPGKAFADSRGCWEVYRPAKRAAV